MSWSESDAVTPAIRPVRFATAALVALFVAATPLKAADPVGFTIGGQVQNAQHLAVQDLQKLPATQVAVSIWPDTGRKQALTQA
jgi:hypothetical protein